MKTANDLQEEILIDKNYFKELVADINAAKKTIDMEVYIFADDKIGNTIADALIDASKRGVKVRVMVDGVGSRNWWDSFSDKMEKCGISTKIFHPLFWLFWHASERRGRMKNFFQNIYNLLKNTNSRNHRKITLIDKRIAYVGSANIVGPVKDDNKILHWHDITVKIQHTDLSELQYAYDKAWGSLGLRNRIFKSFHENPIFLVNFTFRRRRKLYRDLMARMSNCKKRIWITTAYFVPKTSLLKRIIKMAKAGIEVNIILPAHSDVAGMRILIRTYYPLLLKAGVCIYEYQKGLLHTKMLILDAWACVGSSNLNNRSLQYDLEGDAVIQTKSAKEELEIQWNNYINESKQILISDVEKASISERILGKLLLLFKYLF